MKGKAPATAALLTLLVLAWAAKPDRLGVGQWAVAAERTAVFTSTSVDFYGRARGLLRLRPGDVVTAHDPQGVLCGRCVVKQAGLYGFLHVYGDDPYTPEDEGATAGDAITFRVNNRRVKCAGPEAPVWRGDGECINVDLKR